MKQKLKRLPQHAEYIANDSGSFFTNTISYHHASDRALMERFCHDHLYANMSTEFVKICAELGARGYNPNYNDIRERLR